MADNQAEKPQAPEAKKEEKPKAPTTLESVVNESSHTIKASTNTLLGTGAIAGATALFGLDGLVTAASFPIGARIVKKAKAGEEEEFKTSEFAREAFTGALFTSAVWYGFNTVKQIPKAFGLDDVATNILGYSVPVSPLVVGGLTIGALVPALVALYYPLQYVIQNKTFKGFGEYFKKNYWPGLWKNLVLTAFTSAPAAALSYAIPAFAPYLFPIIAGASILSRVLLSDEKLDYKKLFYPSTYLPNFLNPPYLVSGIASAGGKIYRGITTKVYDIGSAIHTTISSLVKAAPKQAQAAAAQTA